MPVVNARELARNSAKILGSVAASRRAALVTKSGKPLAAIVPVDSDALEDWVLANSPEFVRGMTEADRDLAERRTASLDDFLRTLRSSPAKTRGGRPAARTRRATSKRKG